MILSGRVDTMNPVIAAVVTMPLNDERYAWRTEAQAAIGGAFPSDGRWPRAGAEAKRSLRYLVNVLAGLLDRPERKPDRR
jgi:hypothetical protein